MNNSDSKPFEIIKVKEQDKEEEYKKFREANFYGKAIKYNDIITDFQYVGKVNNTCYIQKLNEYEYIDKRTGEIKECNHIENRSQNLNSIRQSIKKIRDLINTNISPLNKNQWLFLTLTYAENMRDAKKLYRDFDNFIRRFKKDYKDYDGYISIIEPQGRGAWHLHVLIKFIKNAPFIDNLAELWKHGFVKIRQMNNCDNIGAYFSAYLGNIELTPESINELSENGVFNYEIEEKEVEEDNKKVKKKFIKGGRLYMYPPKMNIIRYSKNMKKPIIEEMTFREYEKKVGLVAPTFSQFSNVFLNGQFSHSIVHIQYNKQKAISQAKR